MGLTGMRRRHPYKFNFDALAGEGERIAQPFVPDFLEHGPERAD